MGEDRDFYEHLGQAIVDLREEAGMDRRALAESAGISYPYLSELEKGRKHMSARALQLVARALEVRPYQLLERAERRGERPVVSGLREGLLSDLASATARLRSADLEALLAVARRLATR